MSEFAAILTALGGVVLAMGGSAIKIWSVVSDVNQQLRDIAREADERRDRAEEQLAKVLRSNRELQAHVERLEAEVRDLRTTLQREREHNESRIEALASENARLSADNERLENRISALQKQQINSVDTGGPKHPRSNNT